MTARDPSPRRRAASSCSATALLFLLVGALHGAPPLVALAGAILTVLLALYLAFYPTAILLRRKKIELSWWVPPGDQPGGALAVDRPFQLHLAFRNHGSRKLRILSTNILGGDRASRIDERPSATVKRGQQVEVTTTVKPLAAGYQVLHGAALTFGDALGLFDIEAFFPNPIAVKVFPRTLALRGQPVRAVGGALHEQVGLHHVRRRGLSGELRELREHTPRRSVQVHRVEGDRAARPADGARPRERDRDHAHRDASTSAPACAAARSGETPLDWACDSAAALAQGRDRQQRPRSASSASTRARSSSSRADTGHHHYLQLVDRLLDMRVDRRRGPHRRHRRRARRARRALPRASGGDRRPHQDRAAARRSALDVDPGRPRRPALRRRRDRPAVPAADRPDARPRQAKDERGASRAPVVETDSQLAPLRQFCRLRGIELPYRTTWEHGRRAAGFARAVERAVANGRPDVVVLISAISPGFAEDEARAKTRDRAAAQGRGQRRRARAVADRVPAAPRRRRTAAASAS